MSTHREALKDFLSGLYEIAGEEPPDWTDAELDEAMGQGEPPPHGQPSGEPRQHAGPKAASGRWITIGGKKGEEGKRHGGTPVYVENGRITKGAPALTGRKIDALKEEGEHAGRHKEVHAAKSYDRARYAKQARKEGINPADLHQLAAEMIAHNRAHVEPLKKMLQHARKVAESLGSNLDTLKARAARGIDHDAVRGLDDVAQSMAATYPEFFHDDPDNPEEKLLDYLLAGNPEPMSEADAYEQAMDELRRHKEQAGGDEPVPFAMPDDGPLARAKAADLVTLPPALQKGNGGTRCASCQFVRGFGGKVEDYCDHKEVDQSLDDGATAMCCKFWDAPGTKRAWEDSGQYAMTGATQYAGYLSENVRVPDWQRQRWRQLAAEYVPHLLPEHAHLANRPEELGRHLASLPPDEEFRAAALAGIAKKGWYANTAKELYETFGADAPRFAAILAATSPRVPLQRNLLKTLQVFDAWENAGRPTGNVPMTTVSVPKYETDSGGREILDARGEPIPKMKDGVPVVQEANVPSWLAHAPGIYLKYFPGHLPNMVGALSATDEEVPHYRLSGHKVDAFRRNTLGDLEPSTNDVHMANFGAIPHNNFKDEMGYGAYSAKIRKVAKQLGWHPAEVQETIWSSFRELARIMKGGQVTPEQALRGMTHEGVGRTVDFATLMRENPHVRRHLESIVGRGRIAGPAAQGGRPAGATSGVAAGLAGRAIPRIGEAHRRIAERTRLYSDAIREPGGLDHPAESQPPHVMSPPPAAPHAPQGGV